MKAKYGAPLMARKIPIGQSIGDFLQQSGVPAGAQSLLYTQANNYIHDYKRNLKNFQMNDMTQNKYESSQQIDRSSERINSALND